MPNNSAHGPGHTPRVASPPPTDPQTRAEALGITVQVGDHRTLAWSDDLFGAVVQYPAGDGEIYDYRAFCAAAHANGTLVTVVCDLMSLVLLTPPGEFGADVAVGSA